MKNKILFSFTTLLIGALAAYAAPSDDVTSAAQKLAGEPSYSWHATVVVPPDARFKPGPTDGKMETGKLIYVKMSTRGGSREIYIQGTNAVLTDPDGGWETLADAANNDEGPGRMIAGMVKNFKAPADQALAVLPDCQDLEETNGVYSSDLTPGGAKKMLSRRGGNSEVSDASGSVMFWVSNGELTKVEMKLKGTVTFNDNPMTIDRDTTVEITDVGSTTIQVPDDVKKLLGGGSVSLLRGAGDLETVR